MSITPPSKGEVLGWLAEVDSNLQKVTTYLDTIFTDIESCPQETVDYLCECAGDYASYILEYGKVKILNGLAAQKASAQEMIDKYGPLAAAMGAINNPSLDTIVTWAISVVKVIKLMYEIVIKPYKEALEFIMELTNQIIRISTSMQKIASYVPPKAPDINFNKFKITFTPFSIGDMQEEIPYPDPPALRPFPNPFSDSIELAKSLKKSTLASGTDTNSSDVA